MVTIQASLETGYYSFRGCEKCKENPLVCVCHTLCFACRKEKHMVCREKYNIERHKVAFKSGQRHNEEMFPIEGDSQ